MLSDRRSRFASSTGFDLSSGLKLGPYGSKNVSWGDWTHFVQYVAVLNSFVPKSLIPGLALGNNHRACIALGITAPLSYSVFTIYAFTKDRGAEVPDADGRYAL